MKTDTGNGMPLSNDSTTFLLKAVLPLAPCLAGISNAWSSNELQRVAYPIPTRITWHFMLNRGPDSMAFVRYLCYLKRKFVFVMFVFRFEIFCYHCAMMQNCSQHGLIWPPARWSNELSADHWQLHTTGKKYGIFGSTVETHVFDMLICWKLLGTNHKLVLWI